METFAEYLRDLDAEINKLTNGEYTLRSRKVHEFLDQYKPDSFSETGISMFNLWYYDLIDNEKLYWVINDYFQPDWEYIYPEAYDTQPSDNPQTGYIYLVKLENGLYKIGKSKYLAKRMEVFAVSFPMKWELYYSFQSEDYTMAEKTLHVWFSKKREIGEWFRLDERDINSILAIKDWDL